MQIVKEDPKAINLISPEHLEIDIKNLNGIIKNINNAGSILLGNILLRQWETILQDQIMFYTSGSAKFSSGLSVNDFKTSFDNKNIKIRY